MTNFTAGASITGYFILPYGVPAVAVGGVVRYTFGGRGLIRLPSSFISVELGLVLHQVYMLHLFDRNSHKSFSKLPDPRTGVGC